MAVASGPSALKATSGLVAVKMKSVSSNMSAISSMNYPPVLLRGLGDVDVKWLVTMFQATGFRR